MQDSIFTKIIKGEIPSYKIFEDANTFAFLDIHPIQPGQVLVVPKQQVDFVWDMDGEQYAALMATVQKIGQHLRDIFPNKTRVGVIIEGLDVSNHAHIKVFPFSTDVEFRHSADVSSEPDHTALTQIAEKLRMKDDL